MTGTKPRTSLPADYGDATPEQVAKSVLRFWPDAPENATKPRLGMAVRRGSDGVPLVAEAIEHDQRRQPHGSD